MQPSLFALFKRFSGARHWPVWALVGLLRLLAWLPLPVLYGLGVLCGDLAYRLHRTRREVARRNLAACFPEKSSGEIAALARRHFQLLAAATTAGGVAWWGSRKRLTRLMEFRNREILDKAQRRGDNIIALAPHFVGLEFGGIYLSAVTQMVSMYQRHKNPLLNALIKQHRARFGCVQHSRRAPAKSMIRSIRQGRLFYYLPDQDPGRGKGVFAPFYSIPTATYAALGRIARLGNATVIPCATLLLPRGRGFEIVLGQPLADFPCGDEVEDAAQMNRAVEEMIAHAPAQYLWSHRRFKTRPAGEAPFYSDE